MSEPRVQRRLAAVLAADVAGYSRLIGADEDGTLAALRSMWATRFNPTVATHHGRIAKMMGDGALVEFASAVDAVECALAIQGAMAAHNATSDHPLTLRIGINLGDIVVEDGDIFGDGVNIAARLEGEAPQGGILLSDTVHEQIRGKVGVLFHDLGELELKNISHPVAAWVWGATARKADTRPAQASTVRPLETRPSIAVLPFNNMSGDVEQDYFSDGISEDIITDLSKIAGLLVVARNSSFTYKGTTPDIRRVGRELGVTSVLEGSIRRAGNRVRITAQLIDAVSGHHLWAERYDRDLTDIFAVQDEVTMKIVSVLKVKLRPSEGARQTGAYVPGVQAHDLFLRGRLLHDEAFRNPENAAETLRQTIAAYEGAIALDPGYALAYAALSLAYNLEVQNQWLGLPDAMELGIGYAQKAIDLDPTEAFGHFSFGIMCLIKGDPVTLKTCAEKALSLNPNFAAAYSAIGNAEIFLGHPEAALPYFDISSRLDPSFSAQLLHFRALAQLVAGDDLAAVDTFRERLEQVPRTDISRPFLAAALGHLGRSEDARAVWHDQMQIKPNYDLDSHLARLPFRPADLARIRAGLAAAGLPA
ncbi:MAG: adenylate/guanylate cyclase domain-containing protein [Pseudomonadota bacterium]